MKALALLAVWMALPVFSQDAKVIELSKSDAASAKTAYERLLEAQKAWETVKSGIDSKYTIDTQPSYGLYGDLKLKAYKSGWWDGFVFSEDFRFILPKVKPQVSAWGGNTCFMPTAKRRLTWIVWKW